MLLRSFEYLGACSSGNTTLSPGEGSFTTALIWALKALADAQSRFLVSELSSKIREAPNFPIDQVPVQFDRGVRSLQRIMLAPLPEISDQADSTLEGSSAVGPQGLLNLHMVFNVPPTKKEIRQFGEAMNRFMCQNGMPVDRIIWGGLTSWSGSQPSPRAQEKKLAAVRFFENAGLRRRLARSNQTVSQSPTPGLPTPMSTTEPSSRFSTPGEIPQSVAKRRKGSDGQTLLSAVDGGK